MTTKTASAPPVIVVWPLAETLPPLATVIADAWDLIADPTDWCQGASWIRGQRCANAAVAAAAYPDDHMRARAQGMLVLAADNLYDVRSIIWVNDRLGRIAVERMYAFAFALALEGGAT